MLTEIRTHLGAANFRKNRRAHQSHVKSVQDEDSDHQHKSCSRRSPWKLASSRGGLTNSGKWCHKAANCWLGEEKQVHQIQGKAGTASSSSSQSTLMATDAGTKEIGLIESVHEDAEISWLFLVADAVTISQLSMDGAHSLVDSGAHVHTCPESFATHATLQALPECWRGLNLRSASGKMLKVWGVYNAMNLRGKVFTVKMPFVVCELRRRLLSLAMLEDKGGFHWTISHYCLFFCEFIPYFFKRIKRYKKTSKKQQQFNKVKFWKFLYTVIQLVITYHNLSEVYTSYFKL